MSHAAGTRVSCEGCGKTFMPRPEWYGKKVKCLCGHLIPIPHPPPKAESIPAQEDGLYDLAPEGVATSKAKQHAAPPELIAAAKARASHVASVIRPGGGAAAIASPVLGYIRRPPVREQERFSATSDTMMDMKRDVHVPVALLIVGLLLYVSYYAFRYEMGAGGIAIATIGLSVMTAFKAALLIVFAMVIAGPVGVSFGGVFTAALKLAAIAVFCDGVTTWVDAGVGKMTGTGPGLSGMISFPISLGIYWVLLIYLFSMDPGDSWLVVMLLAVFDFIVRWALLLLVLTSFLGWTGS